MDEFTIHRSKKLNTTVISNQFIDNYMMKANGEFVKIYLYLLRTLSTDSVKISIASIADKFNHTEADVKRALSYWEKLHLFQLEYNDKHELTGLYIQEPEPPADQSVSQTGIAKEEIAATTEKLPVSMHPLKPEIPVISDKTAISPDRIKQLKEKTEIQQLIFITETYLQKTLNSTEIKSILYFYDDMHFSIDLIEYLVEYCVSNNHKSIHYMMRVAENWYKDSITTVEQAKAASSMCPKFHYHILNAFGIRDRAPVPTETEYITKWTDKDGFTPEVIIEACNRTMSALHKPNFEYADKILSSWKTAGVKHIGDIKHLDEAYLESKKKKDAPPIKTNKFNNFEQRSYNFDELEKELLNSN